MALDIKFSNTVKLQRHLDHAEQEKQIAIARLASGEQLEGPTPYPSERALADNLRFRVKSLESSKKNLHEAVSLLQTAQGTMEGVHNLVIRMKELNLAATNPTINDHERAFIFMEYQALHEEIDRLVETTQFQGIPLLNGEAFKNQKNIFIRVDSPHYLHGLDVNSLNFSELKHMNLSTENLGLKSAQNLLEDVNEEDGITLNDAKEILDSEDLDIFPTSYDEALHKISSHRASFGAMENRLQRGQEVLDVYQENLAAAHSKITDVNYAQESARLIKSQMLIQATTALMSQSHGDLQNCLHLLR